MRMGGMRKVKEAVNSAIVIDISGIIIVPITITDCLKDQNMNISG